MQAVTSSFESEDVIDSGTSDPQQSYLRAGAMSQLDKFLLTHGACSMLQGLSMQFLLSLHEGLGEKHM